MRTHAILIGNLLMLLAGTPRTQDSYLAIPRGAIHHENGIIPSFDFQLNRTWLHSPRPIHSVFLDDGSEAYLGAAPTPQREGGVREDPWGTEQKLLYVRLQSTARQHGVWIPSHGAHFVVTRFDFDPADGQTSTREEFLRAKRDHYADLARARLPGSEWFRAVARECNAEFAPAPEVNPRNVVRENPWSATSSSGSFTEILEMFSGDRAIHENLQFDRLLAPPEGDSPSIDVNHIAGIKTSSFDWKSMREGLKPSLDPLARWIPADQHALFVPSLAEGLKVLAALEGGMPLWNLLTSDSGDSGVRARYETQLGLRFVDFAGSEAGRACRSLAFTGSDPLLKAGSDVAVLLETAAPSVVVDHVLAAHRKVGGERADVAASEGTIGPVRWHTLVTPDRAVCSYVAAIEGAAVITNSPFQLERIVGFASDRKRLSLAESDEYTVFRDRYRCDTEGESAFLLVTDATLRRWCSPRWRIGISRRARAAEALASLQARAADDIVRGAKADADTLARLALPELGTITTGPGTIHSGAYGNLRFLTPVAELGITKVTKEENDAYVAFRERYQREWREFFDPIAIQLELRNDRIEADVTIMPLTEGTSYRDWISAFQGRKLGPLSADARTDAAFQCAFSVDVGAATLKSLREGLARLAPSLGDIAFSWIDGGVSISLDEGGFVEARREASDDFWKPLSRPSEIPVVLAAGVRHPVALGAFLTGLRATWDSVAGGTSQWLTSDHRGVPVVSIISNRVTWISDMSIHYATVEDLLLVTLNEDALKRAIDRRLDQSEGKPRPTSPWLGSSLALRLDRNFAEILMNHERDTWRKEQQTVAFGALPILMGWKHRWPDLDPVEAHQRLFGTRLSDSMGGAYVWNEKAGTMESATYGYPGAILPGPSQPEWLKLFHRLDAGLTFENQGVRARLVIE